MPSASRAVLTEHEPDAGLAEDAAEAAEFETPIRGTAVEFGVPDLADGIVVQLDAEPTGRSVYRLYAPLIDKKTVPLDLRPISVREPDYELREQLADGSWRVVDPGPEKTYTGTITGEPDGYVAASWTDEGLLARMVFSDGTTQWIQPLSDFVVGAEPGTNDETWTLTVNRIAPAVGAIANESHTCGSAYTGPTPTLANAACMNPVAWSLDSGPSGMTINAATGVLSWSAPTVTGSPFTVTIRATNAIGFDTESWRLGIDRLTPVIVGIPDETIPQSAPYTGPIPSLTVPSCMNPVTDWSLVTGPIGMTINSSNGEVTWLTPTAEGSPHPVTIRATNSAGFDDETWALTVEGAPAATLTSAVLSRPNAGGPDGFCDLPVDLTPGAPISSEPRSGGVTELRIAFDLAPGDGGAAPVTIEEDATCPSPPTYSPYTGTAVVSAVVESNELVLTFTPGLENLRTYRIHLGPEVTSVPGQFVEIRGLVGDVDSSGSVNAVDRALIVGAWTSPAGFTCGTDLDSSSRTNAVDRALVVGAWTAPSNCAP